MAQVIVNIATAPEARKSRGSQEEYQSFRAAENSGKGENRRTTWYDVRAKIPQAEADTLAAGQPVCLTGRIEPTAFVKRKVLEGVPVPTTWDDVVKVLKAHEALGTSLVMLTSSVKPHQFKRRDQADTE
jgi:hypothetical protein